VSRSMAWEAQAEVNGGFADEAGLCAGLRAGKAEAFEALHAAYAAPIYNLALRIVDDRQEAEDVAQEVLLKVFRGLPGGETDLNLAAWLYRVTVNAAFDQVRARKRRPATVVADAGPETPSVVDEYERAELSRRVESTLRELPKRQQLALVLRDVHGMSVGETASVLGLTRGSADVLLSRARAGFRRLFLSGVGSISGRCDLADKALAAGVGRNEPVPASLLEHSRTCPDCRRAVEFWGAAPIGLGILLPQVALPAKLSLGATLAAAQAAGIAVPAGLGAGAAAGAASTAAASAAGAGASAVASTAAGTAGGAGLLAALGSAAGVKVATIAVVATAVVGIAGVSARQASTADAPGPVAATHSAAAAGEGLHAAGTGAGRQGTSQRERARLVARALGGRGGDPAGAHAGIRAGDGQGAGRTGGERGSSEQASGGSQGSSRQTGSGGKSGASGGVTGATGAHTGSSGTQDGYGAGSGSPQGGVPGQGDGSSEGGGSGGTSSGSGGGAVSK